MTKLYTPPARPGLVVRPRFLKRLQAGLAVNLVLTSAPAGCGRATLLSEWIRSNQPVVPTAWLSLKSGENAPARFWKLIAALKTLKPSVGEMALSLLQSWLRSIISLC